MARHHGVVGDLLAAWTTLIGPHTADPDAVSVGERLLTSWSQPHRRYHCVAHLRDVLDAVEFLAAYADNADAVRLAAWYHDSVYDGRPDDEERSARRAETEMSRLGVAAGLVDEVARLVRLTVSHDPAAGDHNGEVISDADLSALAAEPADYRRNSAAIRQEYAHIDDAVFAKGRLQVLATLLEAPAVFRTEAGRRRWEAAARQNMVAELADLTRTGR
jgi:predicted metal-dependent HD superfamily phosphohydrolase